MAPAFSRFLRYAAVGISTLAFDLVLLYAAVTWLGVPYYIATPCSFLIAVSLNYAISRRTVFHRTERSWRGGYAYFALAAALGALATTTLVALLVSGFHLYFLLARILVAGAVGMANYLFNLHFNFRVAGKH